MSLGSKILIHRRGKTGFALTSSEAECLSNLLDDMEGLLSGWDELMCADPRQRSNILHGMRSEVKITLEGSVNQLHRLHKIYDQLNKIMNAREGD